MNSRSYSLRLLLAAALALAVAGFPALGQDTRNPVPPAPPATPPSPENPQRPPDAERPLGTPPGRGGGFRDERHEGRVEPRHDGPRGPEEGRRPDEGPRRDGDRGPGSSGGRERGWNIPLPPPPPPVPTPYIGVITVPPPAVLSAQLSLKEGFGLVVAEVLPDSPAAKAGLQKYDVVTKFNDQQLVDPSQFSILVRGAGKDSDATLTILRQAREQTVPVKIGERMVPQRMSFPDGMDPRGHMDPWKGPGGPEGMHQHLQDRMKEYGEKMRDYQERIRGWQKNPTGDAPQPPAVPNFEAENAGGPINPVDILVQAQPGGARQIRLFQPNGNVSYYTADTKMMLKDDTGEIEVSTKDGKRVVVARDARGATIFDGPIDTEEQRKALPEEVRKKLETIQVRATASATANTFEAPVLLPPGADNVQ